MPASVQRQHLLRRRHAGTAVRPDRPTGLDPESGESFPQPLRAQEPPRRRRRCRWPARCGRRGCARRQDRPARPRPGTAARPAHPATPHRRRRAPPRPQRRVPASRPAGPATFPGSGEGTSAVSGNPAAVQAAIPPSSTRTSGSPAHRSSHQARAALLPSASSYATTELSSLIPHRRNASCSAPGSGSGCRPRLPSPTGAARSRSRSTATAPGRCPDAYNSAGGGPPSRHRTSSTTGRGADTFRTGSVEVAGIDQRIAGVHYVILADPACASRTRLLGVVPFQ